MSILSLGANITLFILSILITILSEQKDYKDKAGTIVRFIIIFIVLTTTIGFIKYIFNYEKYRGMIEFL